jgi:hypothetical protein
MATTSPMIGSPIACLLKLAQCDGVGAHQRQNRQTEHYEYDVEHDRLLAGRLLAPTRVSIRLRIGGPDVRIL